MTTLALLVLAGLSSGAVADEARDVDFDRDVRPILADNCFVCHGPDPGTREADLRLDRRESALEVIEPGDPARSRLWRMITSGSERRRMPPVESKLSLSDEQRGVLKRWIEAGAPYEPHWSFQPLPRRVAVPDHSSEWARDDLDRFVEARLVAEGLRPSPPADRERWLRRVSLELTGLPPTPEQADDFLADRAPGAFERVVDRLLASPFYGERMATPWLDLARYADSYGYQSDRLSPTWPYRDWVVRAFQDNLPFDRFATWQIAGDLLENATRDQRLATAFSRLHRMTNEGGSLEQEWRNEYVADRTHTFGTAFLGLTVECARCHDHKYDPLTQRDYYSLYAFFNSIDEWGMYHDSSRVPTPSLLLPTAEQDAEWARLKEAAAASEADYAARLDEAGERFRAWRARPAPDGPAPAPARPIAHLTLDAIGEGGRVRNAANLGAPATAKGANAVVPGHRGGAVRFTGDDPVELPGVGPFAPHSAFSFGLWLWLPDALEDGILLHQSRGTDVGYHGMELSVRDGRLFFALVRFWPGNALAVRSRDALPRERWLHVVATYDAGFSAGGLRLYVDGESVAEVARDRLTKDPRVEGDTLALGQRFRDRGLERGRIDDLRVFDVALAPVEVAAELSGTPLAALWHLEDEAWEPYYLRERERGVAAASARLVGARRALLELQTGFQETSVMEELPEPRPAHLLARGAYDAPRTAENRVERRPPEFLTGGAPRGLADRRALAAWLTSDDHPLTARVAVNRFWQQLFGTGLVATADNFGVQGALPSHPALLDYLAREFVDSGWDVKGLVRRLVLSATYRQDSVRRPDLAERDPDNRLLARGPSRRLPAEAIRDTALFAAGLLDTTRGGPPVSPYQPEGLWTENNTMSPAYEQSVGEGLYRRSLYTVWKRTAPMPNMTVFDAPSRELCEARRQATLVPLQALVLLNDVQFVEAARVLAERALREEADTGDAVRAVYRRLTGTRPSEATLEILRALHREQRALFAADPGAAAALRSAGEAAVDASLGDADVAPLVVVAQAVLSLDATIWKR